MAGDGNPSAEPGEPRNRRFTLLDGLRGVAALAVTCYHIGGTGSPSLRDVAPGPLKYLLLHGFVGVPIFFVVSGFTIAWSLRNARMNGRVFGRFLLRRSLRLDPPYWAAIFITILLPYQESAPPPSLQVVAGNMFYVADLLGIPKVNTVYWTLFLELQFYCVLAALLWLAAIASPHKALRALFPLALGGLFLLSLLEPATEWPDVPGLFVNTWYAFFVGVCLAWFHAGRLRASRLLLVAIPVGLYAVLRSAVTWKAPSFGGAFPVTVVATALLVFVASKRGGMGSWLSGPIIQYFGRISYSLYLVHGPFGQRLTTFASGLGTSTASTVFAAVLGLAASVLGAHLLWRFVEVPSTRWSRSIDLRQSPTT